MKQVTLGKSGKFALIDDDDFERVNKYKWGDGCGYAVGYIKNANNEAKLTYMHRFIMNTPKELEVDHLDHDGYNNQKSNLRNCTHKENMENNIYKYEKLHPDLCNRFKKTLNEVIQ